MFKSMRVIKAIAALCILTALFVPAGCGKGNKNSEAELQSAQGQKSEEKPPKMLKEIEENVELIFNTLGGPSVNKEGGKGGQDGKEEQQAQDVKQKVTGQEETKKQGTKQEETKQQSGGQEEKEQQSGQQEETKQQDQKQQGEKQQETKQKNEKPQDDGKWSEIDGIINNLHFQWNSFMPEVSKKGADVKIIDGFDNALNELTTSVVSKDAKKVMASANKLYSHIADLYSLYKTKMSPEEKRMIYYCRNIILESDNENWESVKKDFEQLEKSWALFRNTLNEQQKEIGDKLDFSLYELGKVIEQENKQLTSIKGRILLSNTAELEKSFEKF